MKKLKHLAKIAAGTACIIFVLAFQAFFIAGIAYDLDQPVFASYCFSMSFAALVAFVFAILAFALLDEVTPFILHHQRRS